MPQQPKAILRAILTCSALAIAALSLSCFDSESIECDTGAVCPAGTTCAAVEPICLNIGDTCGNGEIDEGEACDDGGKTPGDGCNADCTSTEVCGNGFEDPDEECDDGSHCADGTSCASDSECSGIGDGSCRARDDGVCAADCQSRNECGNGVRNAGEECDDGNDTNGDGCDNNCTNTGCGNGIATSGEACDDGNDVNNDGCDNDCTVTGCGNGITSGAEVCDDGKQCESGVACTADDDCTGVGDGMCKPRDGDGCSASCASNETCGNEITDGPVGEVCDDGKQCQNGTDCNVNADCTGVGDGLCRPRDGDGCSATCTSTEVCGNGITDTAASEICDDGKHCSNGDSCVQNTDCVGIGDELCQTRNGDGCSANCQSDESCGNGEIDSVTGEICDDGKHCENGTPCVSNSQCAGIGDAICQPRDGDGCRSDCRSGEGCGNNTVDVGEECDDGNADNQDDCVNDNGACKLNVCGDTFLDLEPPVTEECDVGGGNTATCNADCTVAECGDGFVNPNHEPFVTGVGEQCDNLKRCTNGTLCDNASECVGIGDGTCAARDSATCDFDCTVAFCGDGHTNTVRGEACDEAGGESATCDRDCTAVSCGDGTVNATANEQCDIGTTCANGDPCDDSGDCGGGACIIRDSVACDMDDCTLALCGDTNVNAARGETCDEGGNTLSCDADCTVVECGDGFVNPVANELCDNLKTCESGGSCSTNGDCSGDGDELCRSRNSATCDEDCSIAFCGDGFTNSLRGEQCDTSGESLTCDPNCTFVTCGDGTTNATAGEQCDAGMRCEDNSTPCTSAANCTGIGGGTCAIRDTASCDMDDCSIAFCGDANVNAARGEACDDGAQTASCDFDCTAVVCGDGVANTAAGEACDDGGLCTGDNLTACTSDADCSGVGGTCTPRDGDGCSADCLSDESCGNNEIDAGEVCDDGNNVNGDGCSADCQSNETCGNGITDVVAGEACDDGLTCANGDPCTSDANCGGQPNSCKVRDDGNGCSNQCKRAGTCGDSVTQDLFEDCDDGDADNTDDCPDTCVDPFCGDGFTHSSGSGTEQCDDGMQCDDLTTPCVNNADCDGIGSGTCAPRDGDGCTSTCQSDGSCGNNILDAGEGCDGGANCNGSCLILLTFACNNTAPGLIGDASCSSGVCDDVGNASPGICEPANTCGNGAVEGAEACDDGGTSNGDGCDSNCLKEAGVTCTAGQCAAGLVCDTLESNTCETAGVCGNGTVDGGEVCDDGDTDSGDGCSGDCLSDETCGNDIVDTGESCDDNNDLACGTCDATCDNETTPAAATGSITAVATADLLDGETFTLDDGYNSAVVFEFDLNATCTGNCIVLAGGETAIQVASAMVAAIDGVGAGLLIDADNGGGANATVDLTHDRQSSNGNQAIAETVAAAGFTVTGMTGGAAGDCPAATECTDNGDCASNSCTGGTCD